jgi:hypothetical protein
MGNESSRVTPGRRAQRTAKESAGKVVAPAAQDR